MLAVKSYFDGSELVNKCITLAALVADGNTWSEIEDRWEKVRAARGNPKYIHMTDLMSLAGIYEDWKKEDRDYLENRILEADAAHEKLMASQD